MTRLARIASIVLVAALLVATAVAFVVTERLKLTPSPVTGARVPHKVFSPVCECATGVAVVRVRLRRAERLSAVIVDRDERPVRTLAVDAREGPGWVELLWDGRDDEGAVVADGEYRPRLRLARGRKTIVMPNPIRVDSQPPTVKLLSLGPLRISPDGDGRRERVVVKYRVSEPARIGLYVDGERRVLRKGRQLSGKVEWNGRSDGDGAPAGAYRLALVPTDVAGNVGRPSKGKRVTVRYVVLGRARVEARPGGRIRIAVRTDAVAVAWTLGGRSGRAKPGTLRLRAPLQPGRHTLTVTANGHAARAAVFVRRAANG